MLLQDWNKYGSNCVTFILLPEDEILVFIYFECIAKNTCLKHEMHSILRSDASDKITFAFWMVLSTLLSAP